MNKKASNPLRFIVSGVQKLRAKVSAYMTKRPHRSFRKTANPRNRLGGTKLPSVWQNLKNTHAFLRSEKWLLIKLGLLFAGTSFLLAGGVSQIDFIGLKDSTLQFFGGDPDALLNTAALFSAAVTGTISLPQSELQQFMGWFVGFVFWLAVVWAARMRVADKVVKARDALYNCCAPLVPAAVLLGIIVLQLLPAAVAMFLFAVLQTGGLLNGGVEVMMFSVATALLFLLSMYWLSASLLALAVVTLPGMYPWKALSAASELIIGQRWAVALRLLVLGLLIALMWAVVLLPALLLDGWLRWDWLPIVPIVVQLLSALSLIYSSVYIYKLYRSLL